jgi:CRP/FNR family cyclic AMP-dependent transcriptional regulator
MMDLDDSGLFRRDIAVSGAPEYPVASRWRSGSTKARSKRSPGVAPAGVLDWDSVAAERVGCERGSTIFSQGDPATRVMFIESGLVRLSVLSPSGKEAVVAVLEPSHFVGEGCLAGQPIRTSTATTMCRSTILVVEKQEMVRQLHSEPRFADLFIAHILRRNICVEEDLIDQLFNSSEKRLARALLRLARCTDTGASHCVIPRVSQELLAEMIGTTRARVSLFMNRFRRLGFIAYENSGNLTINNSLSSVVLRD